jgi:hypothetical protein
MNPDSKPPVTPTPPVAPTTAPAPAQAQANSTPEASPLKQIRTFQGDIAEALGQQKTSIFSLQQQAHAKNVAVARLAPELPEDLAGKKKIIMLVIGTIVLVGLGVGGTWYAYSQYKIKTALPVVTIATNRFINVQNTLDFDATTLNRDSLVSAVRTERAVTPAPGAVQQIQLHNGAGAAAPLISTEDFLNILQTSAPGNLVRAFDPLFMIGILGGLPTAPAGGPTHTFIIIKLDSFESAFPGMLAWEPTLANDILPLFAGDAEVQNVTAQSPFTDITIQNKDARILRDGNGHTVLLYSFYANNYLIITDTEDSLRALIGLLDSQTLSR